MYIGFPEASQEPPKQLKGFKKISLSPGSKQTVTFEITDRDLSIWDSVKHDW